MNDKVIFIHSLFRTGSTYLFEVFRKDNLNYCYYEPLNEILSNYKEEKALGKADNKQYTIMRHPQNGKDYFYEYPFNSDGIGVKLFNQNFSYNDFFLTKEDSNIELYDYINSLKEYAREKRPVFQFCRSALRTGWFKSNFKSVNIYIVRDPHDQWMSYNTLENNNYFNISNLMILCKSNLTIVKDFLDFMQIERYDANSLDSEYRYYEFIYKGFSVEMSYMFFYFVWILALFHNISESDIILDLESYENSNAERNRMDKLLSENYIILNFEDLKYKKYIKYDLTDLGFLEIENRVNQIVYSIYKRTKKESLKNIPFLIFEKYFNNTFLIQKQVDKSVYNIKHMKIIYEIYRNYEEISKKLENVCENINKKSEAIEEKDKYINSLTDMLTIKNEELNGVYEEIRNKSEIIEEKDKYINSLTDMLTIKNEEFELLNENFSSFKEKTLFEFIKYSIKRRS